MSQSSGRRVLIFRIGELGDTLVSLPAIHAVRRHFPDARIGFLGNVDAERRHVTAQEVLPAAGLIDEWIRYPSSSGRAWRETLSLIRHLRRASFDTLVYLAPRLRKPNDVRRDLLFFKLAGIKRVIGVRGIEPLPAKSEASLPHVIHELDHLLERLAQDGINVPARGTASIDLSLSDAEHRRAQSWLESNVDAIHERALVGFGPGSKWPSKIWPEERYLETGARLIDGYDICPIVFGGADDRAAGERLISGWRRGVNAAGELPVREAASVLRSCQLYVGNDTGTMHLAAAMGTPCVVVMAALDWPGHWNPYGRGHVVLRRVVPCEGCLLQVCEHQAMRCLKEISVDDVINASQKILEAREAEIETPHAKEAV